MNHHSYFKSIHHPGDAPAALVYARWLPRPVAACVVPVMIAAMTLALQGDPVLAVMIWGLPASLGLATVWARFQMSKTLAEVHVRAEQAAVRSVQECLGQPAPLAWDHIFEIRKTAGELVVTVGWDTHYLPYAEWPDHHALTEALRAARRTATAAPYPSKTSSSHA